MGTFSIPAALDFRDCKVGAHQSAQDAMGIDVLSSQKQVRDARASSHSSSSTEGDVASDAVETSSDSARVVAIGERGGRIYPTDASARARELSF